MGLEFLESSSCPVEPDETWRLDAKVMPMNEVPITSSVIDQKSGAY